MGQSAGMGHSFHSVFHRGWVSSLKEEELRGQPQVSKNRGFTRLYSAVSRSK